MSYVLELKVAKDPRDRRSYVDDPIYHILTRTPERWYTLDGNALPSSTRGIQIVKIEITKHGITVSLGFPSRRQAHVWLVQYEFNAGDWLPECCDSRELEYTESRRIIGYEWDGQNPVGRCVDYKTLQPRSTASYKLLYDKRVDAR